MEDFPMVNEIERKFFIDSFDIPDEILAELTHSGTHVFIRQGYLSTGDPEERVREKVSASGTKSYVRTIKTGSGLSREENEWDISQEEFEATWKATEGRRVEKTRYKYPMVGGLVAEIDFYSNDLIGLVTAEVEFPDTRSAKEFVPPKWFKRDVTNDDRFKNKNLAINGRPVI